MQPTGLSHTTVRHETCGFFFLAMHLNLAVFTHSLWASVVRASTLLLRSYEREPQRRRERECRAPDESTPVDGIHSKPPSTSDIMRVLSLMCESRVCPLCVANEGKHVRKGWLFTWVDELYELGKGSFDILEEVIGAWIKYESEQVKLYQ